VADAVPFLECCPHAVNLSVKSAYFTWWSGCSVLGDRAFVTVYSALWSCEKTSPSRLHNTFAREIPMYSQSRFPNFSEKNDMAVRDNNALLGAASLSNNTATFVFNNMAYDTTSFIGGKSGQAIEVENLKGGITVYTNPVSKVRAYLDIVRGESIVNSEIINALSLPPANLSDILKPNTIDQYAMSTVLNGFVSYLNTKRLSNSTSMSEASPYNNEDPLMTVFYNQNTVLYPGMTKPNIDQTINYIVTSPTLIEKFKTYLVDATEVVKSFLVLPVASSNTSNVDKYASTYISVLNNIELVMQQILALHSGLDNAILFLNYSQKVENVKFTGDAAYVDQGGFEPQGTTVINPISVVFQDMV